MTSNNYIIQAKNLICNYSSSEGPVKGVNIENEWLTADGDHGRLRCRALTVPFVPEGRGSSSTVLGGGSTLVR